MKIAGIYSITSPSGTVYIGQSWDIFNRWRLHKVDFRRGHANRHLANSFRKYGIDSHQFKILGTLGPPPNDQQYNLDILEQFLMNEYRVEHVRLFNLREAGSRGKPSRESIAKMVATRRANGSYTIKPEDRSAMVARFKGKRVLRHSDETKRRLADLARGKKQSDEAKERNRQSQLGRKHSAETKAKIGLANSGRKRLDLAERNRLRAKRATV